MNSERDSENKIDEVARKALEPYTNKNNPNNKEFCNVCKIEKAIDCVDCDRLDVSMCKLDHLKFFGTSSPTPKDMQQCDHGLLGIGYCVLLKGHTGNHMIDSRHKWDTRKFSVKLVEFLHLGWIRNVLK